MKLRTHRHLLWLIPIMSAVIICRAGYSRAECVDCHLFRPGKVAQMSIHAPFIEEECRSCHGEHKGKAVLLLVDEGNALCRRCHETARDEFLETHSGMDVNNIQCSSCHLPHTSELRKLLRPDIHRPLAGGDCQDCHREGKHIPSRTVAILCFKCHDSRFFQGASEHEPVASGDCTVCHDPHGSAYPALLTSSYPLERYLSFDEEGYGLCFSCHDSSYFTVEGGECETGFKNSTQNFHYRHVVKQGLSATGGVAREGTTCRNCHLPHASLRPHLIRQNLDCGEGVLCLRMGYFIRDGVGTCVAGCHKTVSYSSVKAVVEPSIPAGPEKIAVEEPGAEKISPVPRSLCLECHEEDWRRLQRTYVHDPFRRKNCGACHLNHGLDNKLVLTAYEAKLCAGCHDEGAGAFIEDHGGFDLSGGRCVGCHDPHSSGSEALLRKVTHEPFCDRSCNDCHDPGAKSWSIGRPVNEVCGECHEDKTDHPFFHGAITEQYCISCHDPHTSTLDKMLVGTTPGICFGCHEKKEFKREFRHDPVEWGDCGECHDVHGSDSPAMLVEKGNDLCYQCHDAADEDFRIVHRRLEVNRISCSSCHIPHSSGKIKLLRADIHEPLSDGECRDCHREGGAITGDIDRLCFECHEKRHYEGTSRHEPVTSGDCTDCHDPHGSPYPLLLTASYPLERYVHFSEDSYGLCFSCHDSSSFTDKGGAADTGFKNEAENLHYRHVVQRVISSTGVVTREGTTCRNCHLPHSSLRPYLIRQNLDCGEGVLCLRMGYFIRQGTGTCVAGCHKTASYPSTRVETVVRGVPPGVPAEKLTPSMIQPEVREPYCLECHRDDWESFRREYVHEPTAKMRCLDCHLDHGTDNRLMLKAYEAKLCAGCHDEKSKAFLDVHGGYDLAGGRCLGCHDPHSSAIAGLLHEYSHEPFAERSCDDCHDPASGSWSIERPVNDLCADCHEEQTDHPFFHGAVTERYCVSCHDPHTADHEKMLAGTAPELCFRCHEKKDFTGDCCHEPVKTGQCVECHDVHGTEDPDILVRRGNDLCLGCHDANSVRFTTAHRRMAVAGISCSSCHLPHASGKIGLLRPDIHRPLAYGECGACHLEGGQIMARDTAGLCFRCHEPRFFEGVSKHDPAASGDCLECHDPHGSSFPFLLSLPYPFERYASYDESLYGLCFSCHDSDSFIMEGGGADTGFKDRTDNLHNLHVVKERPSITGAAAGGTTCRNCHLPHSSLRPHLIRETLDCGEGVLCLKMGYFVKEGVWTCRAGCHESAWYPCSPEEALAYAAPPAAEAAVEAPALPPSREVLCFDCHKESLEDFERKYVHDSVLKKRCLDCHVDHGQDNKLILVSYEARLCFRCHREEPGAVAAAHGGYDVSGSHCIRCHDPHASDVKSLLYPEIHEPYGDRSCSDCHDSDTDWTLTRPANEICGDCHDEKLEQPFIHSAITRRSCTGCHSPHSASAGRQLLADYPLLCYRCHEIGDFRREYRHEPVVEGDCGECHSSHGGGRPNLLTEEYPQERYQDFYPGKYRLCFRCHSERPFLSPDPGDTGFRKDDVNLHFLHVDSAIKGEGVGVTADVGITCRNCHEPHSTDQPSLIRTEVDCGGVFCLRLDYRKIAEKSRCSRCCHVPQIYSGVAR